MTDIVALPYLLPTRCMGQSTIALRSAAAVYEALAPAVLGYLRSQRAPEPDDLAGEVFVQVAKDLHRFHGDDGALRRWVFTIAHHRLVDDRRRRRVRPVMADRDLPELSVVDEPGSLDPDLVAALGRLTALQREVVVLRFLADLALADVARIIHRPRTAVKALQARALTRLAELLAAPVDQPEHRGDR
ncbi:MAG: sigma-70 family RNA polymerase sigma factor [Acidimicrobiia bacterium]|jgi:RNA polymerase sigma-70 factor (ECF subfamily)|nr:sigma-70 family RNA polymerase sigma factor [Acidimicrobiia bacterium]